MQDDAVVPLFTILKKQPLGLQCVLGKAVVKRIAYNKSYYDGSRDDVINMGYQPCKRCNP